MKLEYDKQELVKSEGLKEYTFQLPQDVTGKRVIMELLSSKLYNNKLASSLREILSNSIDANIEAGNRDKVIDIILPTEEEPYITFRDRGLGMSEERMIDVYINLGVSTKRDSNDAIGAFGVGSISPFSITNQIEVTTIHQEIKYSWVIFKNEDGIPAATLLNKENTDEESGTKVKFYIKPTEIERAHSYIRALTMFSEMNYNIVNSKINHLFYYNHNEKIEEGYFYSYSQSVFYNEKNLIVLIIGEIPYLVKTFDFIRNLENEDFNILNRNKIWDLNYINKGFHIVNNSFEDVIYNLDSYDSLTITALKIPIGQLELTTSREDLVINDKFNQVVREKLITIFEKYTLKLEEEVTAEEDIDKKVDLAFNKFPRLKQFKIVQNDRELIFKNHQENFGYSKYDQKFARYYSINSALTLLLYTSEEQLENLGLDNFNFLLNKKDYFSGSHFINIKHNKNIPLELFLKSDILLVSPSSNIEVCLKKVNLSTEKPTIIFQTNKATYVNILKSLKVLKPIKVYPTDFRKIKEDKPKVERKINLEKLSKDDIVYRLDESRYTSSDMKYIEFLRDSKILYSLPKEGGVYVEKLPLNCFIDSEASKASSLIKITGKSVYFVNSKVAEKLNELDNWVTVKECFNNYLDNLFKNKSKIKNVILVTLYQSEQKVKAFIDILNYLNKKEYIKNDNPYYNFLTSKDFKDLNSLKNYTEISSLVTWNRLPANRFNYIFKEVFKEDYIYFKFLAELIEATFLYLPLAELWSYTHLALKMLQSNAINDFEYLEKLKEEM